MLFGIWAVTLPDLTARLAIAPGTLGFAISAGFVVSMPLMLLGGRLSDRFGPPRLGGVAGLVVATALIGFALAPDIASFIVTVIFFFAASGMYDVAINASGLEREQGSNHRLMPIFHGAFSAGGMVGAVVAGLALADGSGTQLPYFCMAALLAGLSGLWLMSGVRSDMPRRQHIDMPRRQHIDDHPPRSMALLRNRVVVVLAAVTALAFLAEGAMETWSALFLREALGVPVLVGASGVAIFHGAMLAGRAGVALIVNRTGRVRTLAAGGTSVVVGMVVALSAAWPPLVFGGFLLVGLGLAGVAPIAFSLAGDESGGQVGRASSAITVVGYTGFLVGPALIGGLAEVAGLRIALATLIAAGAAIAILALLLQRVRSPAPATWR